MAYPSLANWQDSDTGGSAATSLTMVAPSSIADGDIAFIMVGSDDATDTTQFSINTGTYPGWVKLLESGDSSVDAHFALFVKDADGTEGNVVVDAASADEMQGIYGRITGADYSTIFHDSSTATSSPWTFIVSESGLNEGDEYLFVFGMSMDGGDIGVPTVNTTKITHVTSGTSGNDNAGCYSRYNQAVNGVGTAAVVSTFTTGDKTDGAALGGFALKAPTPPTSLPPVDISMMAYRASLVR